MRILVTGAGGFVGSALTPRLEAAGPEGRAFARSAQRARAAGVDVEVVEGDAVTGAGLDRALAGVEGAYFLIHSMEWAAEGGGGFVVRDRLAAERFAAAARRAGVRRVIYLGGLLP